MRTALRILACSLLGAAVASPAPSTAATIANVTIQKNAGNTADLFDDVGEEATAAQSTAVVTASTATTFDARYAAVVSADRGAGSNSGTTTQSFTGDFTITLQLTEAASLAWSFTLDVLRIGAQTLISDGTGNASVSLGALTGSETGAGSITSGSMSLAALSTLSNASAESTSPNSPFSQSIQAVISGIGTGAAQTVILNFVFSASAVSVDPSGGDFQGDEAALRMGHDSALSSFSADDYPGVGSRTISTDGIFVQFRLQDAPEPGSALLFGLGLAALGAHRRARQVAAAITRESR
jgi:hypothetical protein